MCELKLIVPPGAPPEVYSEVGQAIAAWLTVAETAELACSVRIILRGGAYLSPHDTAAFWDATLPESIIAEVLVDGKSCLRSEPVSRRSPMETMHNATTKW